MRLKRLVIKAFALLATVLAASAIVAALLVPRWLAPKLAEVVRAETGRDLNIDEVAVTLTPWPTLVLSQVRFANAPWGSQPWMAQVGRATAELDLWRCCRAGCGSGTSC